MFHAWLLVWWYEFSKYLPQKVVHYLRNGAHSEVWMLHCCLLLVHFFADWLYQVARGFHAIIYDVRACTQIYKHSRLIKQLSPR